MRAYRTSCLAKLKRWICKRERYYLTTLWFWLHPSNSKVKIVHQMMMSFSHNLLLTKIKGAALMTCSTMTTMMRYRTLRFLITVEWWILDMLSLIQKIKKTTDTVNLQISNMTKFSTMKKLLCLYSRGLKMWRKSSMKWTQETFPQSLKSQNQPSCKMIKTSVKTPLISMFHKTKDKHKNSKKWTQP